MVENSRDRTGISRRSLLAGAAVGGAGLAATLSDPSAALGAASGGTADRRRPLAVEREPGAGLTFEVRVPGMGTLGGFQAVSGLSVEITVAEYRDGSEPDVIRKLPGQVKYPDVNLARPLTADMTLASWIRLVQEGEVAQARKNGSIIAFDQSHTPVAQWDFVSGWPSKYSIEDGPELTIEAITLTHEHLVRVQP